MTFKEFQSAMPGMQIPPVILFHGEEDFLIDEGVRSILEGTLDEGTRGFNLDVVYGSKVDVKEVVALASAFPLMSQRRVVVVKEFEQLATNEQAKELLTAYLQKPLESTCLLLVSLQPDFRKKPFTDLKKHAALVECKSLYDNQIPEWISKRIRQLGKSADQEACRMLQAYVGNSLRAVQNEIDKLFIFVGEKKQITVGDVAEVVGATKGFTIFELQNAVGRKDLREALTILQAMLRDGQSPQMIIVMLTRFFTQLWKISELKAKKIPEASMAREVGINPYFLKQVVQYQSQFSNDHLETGFRALLEADAVLKTTSRDARLVMDLLLFTLVKGVTEDIQVGS
jgi:DNA polymerase III subunit delta